MAIGSPESDKRANWGPLVLSLGVGLAIRLIYFIGVSGHDDVDYFNYALDVLEGTFSTEPASDGSFPFRFRIGMIFPTALMFRIFGPSEYAAAILPLLNSLGLIWLSWWGGSRISRGASLIAPLLMATFPLAIGVSTSLLPGPFAAFLSGLSVLFWLSTEDKHRHQQLTDLGANVRFYLAGVCLGLGYFYRIEVGLFVSFFVGFSVLHGRAWQGCLLAMAGAACVVILENLVYLGLHGEILYRLKVVSGGFAGLSHELSETVLAKKSPMVYLKLIFLKPTDLGLHWAALFMASIACLFYRAKERTPFLLWFWPVALYLFFGSWSVTSYVPTSKDPRYLISVTAPGLVLLAALADKLRHQSPFWRNATHAGLAGTMLGSMLLMNLVFAYRSENASSSRLASGFVMQHEAANPESANEPIWCEHHAALALRCLLPHREIRAVTSHNLSISQTTIEIQPEEIDTGLVVVDHFVIDKYVTYSDMIAPDFLLNPPESWTPIFEAPHPIDGIQYSVVRLLNHLLGGRLAGPGRSLKTDPVIVYEP